MMLASDQRPLLDEFGLPDAGICVDGVLETVVPFIGGARSRGLRYDHTGPIAPP